MGHPCIPFCILSIKELHTPHPSFRPSQQSSVVPYSVPTHLCLPVMAIIAVSLQADDIKSGVKSYGKVVKIYLDNFTLLEPYPDPDTPH